VPDMDLNIASCLVAVDDAEKAVAFYRDALGFEVRNDVSAKGMRWVTLGAPSQPEVSLVLCPPLPDPGASPSERQAVASLMAKGMLGLLNLTTPNCDATFERIRAAGGEVLQEPIDQPWGVRDCAFRDPAGNQIRINQR
jgi:predicted enzyme related to lactoylglutathione lyase